MMRRRRNSFLTAALVISVLLKTSESSHHVEIELGKESGLFEVGCDLFKYFTVEVTEPCQDLRVQVIRTQGEPDLYVSRYPVLYPTEKSLAWSSYDWGHENLTISSWDPNFEVGTFYIGVHAFCSEEVHTGDQSSKFTLLIQSVESAHPELDDISGRKIAGTLQAEDYHYYRFCVPRQCVSVNVSLENCLDAKDCPNSYAWPELLVSPTIPKPTINDHSWKLASISRRSITLVPSDPSFRVGHYYVGVYGWCTPAEHCPDKATCGPCEYAQNAAYNLTVKMTSVPPEKCVSKSFECNIISSGGSSLCNMATWLVTFVLCLVYL
ncbi:uncharacterized protein [Ptychodera flava]|uniref:uncharacterized protein n=1 Tax=Ptychodera flava TaxID=63121 RepID=UPI00396A243C